MRLRSDVLAVIALVLLAACATVPTGPSVMVLPGDGKNFDQFRTDEVTCRQWAMQQTGIDEDRAATQSAATSAVVGTALGAAAGAAIGAAAGNPALGAAAGAGAGLLGGAAVGAGRADAAGDSVQRRYDMAYMQCMYAKGNQIPMARSAVRTSGVPPSPPAAPPPPLPPGVPPPPPGMPPPPPPGASP